MTVHISVDRDLCIGSGNCVHLTHGALVLDDYDVAEVHDVSAATIEQLRRAQRSCPTAAITVEES
ncbi:MAG TPA: ferredoxin [Mycobacterium sp.]|jgi:ferredoxin|nr:ferredoxin [Mycobacterium sp.]HZC93777.1 ferredoxin [Mycobacterium sp.]